jgi:hypothetical protein
MGPIRLMPLLIGVSMIPGLFEAVAQAAETPPSLPSPAVSPEVLKALSELIKATAISGGHQSWISPEFLKSIADLIGAVAWPTAVVICVILFRKELIQLLGHVGTVKVLGAEISLVKRELIASAKEAETASGLSAAPSQGELARAAIVEELVSGTDIELVRRQAEELAAEYERVRRLMQPGDERTRRMEVVVAKMRTIGLAIFSLRHELADSRSPGKRLVAIAALQVKPDYDMLEWLAERTTSETPFVAYHSLVALLQAIRAPDARTHRSAIDRAVEKAKQLRKSLGAETDRVHQLNEIEAAVRALDG